MNFLNEYEADGIYTRYARDPHPESSAFSMHVHDRCEVYFFVSGNAGYLVEGTTYMMEKGSLLIMRPGESHCPKLLGDEPYERYAVNFPVDLFDSIDPERRLMKPFIERQLGKCNHFSLPQSEALFKEMCGEHEDDYERRVSVITGLFSIMHAVSGMYSTLKNRETVPVTIKERLLAYVNAHLFDEITVPSIARHFFLSTSQIRRLFKQASGASPWEYITAKRLIAARERIAGGEGACEAAERCGFRDYSTFYRAYVKRFGNSPRGTMERNVMHFVDAAVQTKSDRILQDIDLLDEINKKERGTKL